MGRKYETITDQLRAFIADQPMFFVATAPLRGDGHVNVSPKGTDSLRVTGPRELMYADLVGSAAETIAHLRENGRITIMWCSFGPKPRILRIHGRGTHTLPADPGFSARASQFPEYSALRSIVTIAVERIADSCGFGVPEMTLVGQRDRLLDWGDRKTAEELHDYMVDNNTVSIDGLPAWEG
ncbi:MAG: pyridoxamine 5'-phosphate oxidase family protein [Acidimicrobiia bacterium]|nr:pyridoxamine 5'-phosphate oxidase family protein [Acidimicrobiia bacterium]